jgi:hypothetical protein
VTDLHFDCLISGDNVVYHGVEEPREKDDGHRHRKCARLQEVKEVIEGSVSAGKKLIAA